jgi:hypothetical protein
MTTIDKEFLKLHEFAMWPYFLVVDQVATEFFLQVTSSVATGIFLRTKYFELQVGLQLRLFCSSYKWSRI